MDRTTVVGAHTSLWSSREVLEPALLCECGVRAFAAERERERERESM